jgi:arginine deiminase
MLTDTGSLDSPEACKKNYKYHGKPLTGKIMNERIKIDINSEIGELEAVIIHPPGPEVENMTPGNAERALYSDILNLSVAKKEYSGLEKILDKYSKVLRIKDLLLKTLGNNRVKEDLVKKICHSSDSPDLKDFLLQQSPGGLADLLIEGVVMQKNTLTKFLSKERYSQPPLHNFFFTRDAAIPMQNSVLISSMANRVRERESLIMETIFGFSGLFSAEIYSDGSHEPGATIEGGDVLVAREDILIIGNGARTSSRGIDFVLKSIMAGKKNKMHVIVQELPVSPESFIHLDMVFTLLDRDYCMVYDPVIYKTSKFLTLHITLDNGKVSSIREEKNIPDVLRKLGMDLKPVYCGGRSDLWTQEREQWHSGANFLAIAPGKVIGYARNTYTIEELSRNGFEIYTDQDIISGRIDPYQSKRMVISLDGSELPRGGGGARCMTMPVKRKDIG